MHIFSLFQVSYITTMDGSKVDINYYRCYFDASYTNPLIFYNKIENG